MVLHPRAEEVTPTTKLEDNAKVAKILRSLRKTIAPYTHLEAAWALDLLATRALATVEVRYPYTIVGEGNRFYDVVEGDGETEKIIRDTEAPWTGR